MSGPVDDLVLDADVLMSLVASGRVGEILSACMYRGVVCKRVEREALWIETDTPGDRIAVDFMSLEASGDIARIAVAGVEVASFLEFAREVDDGEAEAIAIASHRRLTFATDDRRATRVAVRLGIYVVDTPLLVTRWAATTADSVAAVDAIERIETRARYRPAASHPLAGEWAKLSTERPLRTS